MQQNRRMAGRLYSLVATTLILTACSDQASRSSNSLSQQREIAAASASSPEFRSGTEFRINQLPAVDIGGSEGNTDPPLHQVADALRLTDGRIVVANSGNHQLHFYNSSGDFLFAAGRSGSGPGEFRQIEWVRRAGSDTLVVYDAGLERISLFTTDGAFVRSLRLQVPGTAATAVPMGWFRDGTLLARAPNPNRLRRLATEAFRDSSDYLRYTTAGAPIDSVGRFVNDDTFLLAEPFGGHHLSRMYLALPFGRRTLVRTDRDRVYVAEGSTGEIAVFSSRGDPERIFQALGEPRQVTPADIEQFRQRQIRKVRSSRDRQEMERRLAAVPYPDMMPALGALLVDSRGWLWAADYAVPGARQNTWTVLDPDGQVIGRLSTPEGLSVLDIGVDYILGLWRDPATDVEHIRLHSLTHG